MHETWMQKILLGLYTFILVFEPPITPIGQIYLTAIMTVMLIIANGGSKSIEQPMRRTKTVKVLIALILMSAYLLAVNLIDILFIDQRDLFDNRMRCFNQLFVLTSIQITGVLFVLSKAEQYSFSLRDVFDVVLVAGLIEGILVVIAYVAPPVRLFFMRYASDLYANPWHFERRGFGFSATLLDTFGYGIGLLSGILLLVEKDKPIACLPYLAMLIFVSFVNSRTGLVIITLAIMVKLVSGRGIKGVLGLLFLFGSMIFLYKWMPDLILAGNKNSNITIRWVTSALEDFYQIVTRQSALEDAQFVSTIIPLPVNLFEFFFGSGHSVYAMRDVLGYSSDIGYINLAWIYGVIGTSIYYLFTLYIFLEAYRSAQTAGIRALIVFLAISFFLVQLKGNVLGASPGICITYLCVFSVIYFKGSAYGDSLHGQYAYDDRSSIL